MSFYGCSSLRKVDAIIDLSECKDTGNAFTGCSSLEEVRIKGLKVDLDSPPAPTSQLIASAALLTMLKMSSGKTITATCLPRR